MSTLSFKPVTKKTLDDFVDLFEAKGGPSYCWCMGWRGTPEEKKGATKADRKKQISDRVKDGTKVGLLGYEDGQPIAWVSVAPRDTYRHLGGPVAKEGEIIWSLACMYIKRARRKNGFADQLVDAATRYATDNGATLLEAYAVDPDSPSYRHMGFMPLFERANFTRGDDIGTRRHLMRKSLRN